MASGTVGDAPAATYAELLSGRLVDVYVGKDRRHWALHHNLLCHHSEVIQTELQGRDGKAVDRLDLADHDPAGFELLVKWMYQGRLDDVSDLPDANQKYDYAVSCHKLYLLCDRFDMSQLKNVAMDQYRKGLNEAELVPDADEIDDIYRRSSKGSPFRLLMTRIAARQIMDPDSDRDVDTYRQCFENNPDFAIDLVKAMRDGTGGMLFDDPTDRGDPANECEYHDHDHERDTGPSCYTKGNQALKTTRPPRDAAFKSSSSGPPPPSIPTLLPPRRPRRPPILQPPPPPRHARRQSSSTTTNAGPLRRRLTSPASSTVETSTEHATATAPTSHPSPPSPKADRAAIKGQNLTPQTLLPSPPLTQEATPLHPAPDDPRPSSAAVSPNPQPQPQSSDLLSSSVGAPQASPPRGLWQWARAGTLLGKIPHPHMHVPLMTSRAPATSSSSAAAAAAAATARAAPEDDFSVPSAVATDPDNEAKMERVAAAKMVGLGIANRSVEGRTGFSQTKRSSDEIVALMGTPSPSPPQQQQQGEKGEEGGVHGGDAPREPEPGTPSPAPRKKAVEDKKSAESSSDAANMEPVNVKASPQRIPKYKIALAANVLSHRPGTAATASVS